ETAELRRGRSRDRPPGAADPPAQVGGSQVGRRLSVGTGVCRRTAGVTTSAPRRPAAQRTAYALITSLVTLPPAASQASAFSGTWVARAPARTVASYTPAPARVVRALCQVSPSSVDHHSRAPWTADVSYAPSWWAAVTRTRVVPGAEPAGV